MTWEWVGIGLEVVLLIAALVFLWRQVFRVDS